jgi:hypothetical protein
MVGQDLIPGGKWVGMEGVVYDRRI